MLSNFLLSLHSKAFCSLLSIFSVIVCSQFPEMTSAATVMLKLSGQMTTTLCYQPWDKSNIHCSGLTLFTCPAASNSLGSTCPKHTLLPSFHRHHSFFFQQPLLRHPSEGSSSDSGCHTMPGFSVLEVDFQMCKIHTHTHTYPHTPNTTKACYFFILKAEPNILTKCPCLVDWY